MSAERQIPGGAYIVETNADQQQVPAGAAGAAYVVGTAGGSPSGPGGAQTRSNYFYAA